MDDQSREDLEAEVAAFEAQLKEQVDQFIKAPWTPTTMDQLTAVVRAQLVRGYRAGLLHDVEFAVYSRPGDKVAGQVRVAPADDVRAIEGVEIHSTFRPSDG